MKRIIRCKLKKNHKSKRLFPKELIATKEKEHFKMLYNLFYFIFFKKQVKKYSNLIKQFSKQRKISKDKIILYVTFIYN